MYLQIKQKKQWQLSFRGPAKVHRIIYTYCFLIETLIITESSLELCSNAVL